MVRLSGAGRPAEKLRFVLHPLFFGVLGTAALQAAFWAVMALFLPWTGFLVLFLGGWYILFVAVFLIYDQLNDAFRVEEQIRAQFPEQVPVYRDEEE